MERLLTALVATTILVGCPGLPIHRIVLPPTVTGTRESLSDGLKRVTPLYDDDGLLGIRVDEVRQGSLAQHLDLRPGDLILSMANIPCDHVRRCRVGTRRVEAAMLRRRPFRMMVRRAGQTLVIEYSYHRTRPLPM